MRHASCGTPTLVPHASQTQMPQAKWIKPALLIDVGMPSGVPGGNLSTGSAGKNDARNTAAPYAPKNPASSRN